MVRKLRLSSYLILFFVIISISSLTIISYTIGKNREKEIVNNELENIYINIESQISSDIKECNNTIDGVARTMRGLINIDGYTATQLQKYLTDVNNHYIDNPQIMPGFSRIHCYDLNENAELFSSASYESSVSDPYENENGELIITIYKLYDVTDDRSFVICIDISLEELNNRTFTTRHNFTGTWFILDSHHVFLCHPDKLFINQYLGDLHYEIAKYCEVLTKRGSVTYERFVNYRGLESLLVIRPFNTNWFLGVTIPIYEYLNQIRSLKVLYISASIIVILVFCLILISIINKQIRAENNRLIAEQNNINKSKFLASMSHEIRTPLNAVLGIAEINMNKDHEEQVKISFRDIYESGDVLLSLINDILDISKIESNKMEIIPKEYILCKLVEEAIYINQIKYESKHLSCSLVVDKNTYNFLYGDVLKLKQILNNLLSNSFKYTKEGSIEVFVATEELTDNNINLKIIIKDTGIGMTKAQISQLFDEFSRFDQKEEILGTGLGMSITKKLINLLNGDIKVSSIPSKGSTFEITIPQIRTNDTLYDSTLTFTPIETKVDFHKNNFEGSKVLVVDDIKNNLTVARGLLAPYNCDIEIAMSGQEVIDLIEKGNTFDIIFMDYFMPVLNGQETTKIIKEMGYTFPVVALTANAMYGQRQKFMETYFEEFISKPIDSRELDRVLNLFLKNKKKILVVDDNDINLQVAEAYLIGLGIIPDTSNSGENAIEKCKLVNYDLIFMDYNMPTMNGDIAMNKIRKNGFNGLIYALSASDSDSEKFFTDLGFDGFLIKPLSNSNIIELL